METHEDMNYIDFEDNANTKIGNHETTKGG